MKKILIVNQHFLTGGIKKSLDNLLPILRKNYEVNVMFLCGSTREFEKKYPGVMIKTPFLLGSVLSSLEDLKDMNMTFIRIVIKVIFLFISKIIGKEKGISLIIKCAKKREYYDYAIAYSHDNWFEKGDFFGGANEFVVSKVKAKKKIAWLHGEPKTIGLKKEQLFKTYKDFDEIVTVSKACKHQFEELSEKKITCHCIKNIYDIEDIRRKSMLFSEEKKNLNFKIVTVGRMSKVAKRIDKVNEIAKKLRDAGYQFEWTVVGDGSEYEECVNICKEYKLNDIVHYIGNKDNPYCYIKKSDVFVLVSDSEAMPMVINESLIVGTPVLTTNFPAAYEVIIDGKNGFIVNKDIDSIYEKIAYCIDNQNEIKKMKEYIKENPINNEKSIRDIKKLLN